VGTVGQYNSWLNAGLTHYKISTGSERAASVKPARAIQLGAPCIKMLKPRSRTIPAVAAVFLRDACRRACSHANIAALEEIGQGKGQPYLVFEFMSGDTLGAVLPIAR
jgi:hypothetical protein